MGICCKYSEPRIPKSHVFLNVYTAYLVETTTFPPYYIRSSSDYGAPGTWYLKKQTWGSNPIPPIVLLGFFTCYITGIFNLRGVHSETITSIASCAALLVLVFVTIKPARYGRGPSTCDSDGAKHETGLVSSGLRG